MPGPTLIIGLERTPQHTWTVRESDTWSAVPLSTMDEPRVYWDATLWPSLERLVRFHQACIDLGLLDRAAAMQAVPYQ